MAELVPVPLRVLLRRAHHEFRRRRAIFDLPERKFMRRGATRRGPALDFSVPYAGAPRRQPDRAGGRAAHPARPEHRARLARRRPHLRAQDDTDQRPPDALPPLHRHGDRRLQHRVVAGAAVSRSRCREYVKAAMLIEILGALGCSRAAGSRDSGLGIRGHAAEPFVFDISVGYDLEGIRSAAGGAGGSSRCAMPSAIVDELRREIPDEFARVQGLPVPDVPGRPASRCRRFTARRPGDGEASASSSSASSASTPSSS